MEVVGIIICYLLFGRFRHHSTCNLEANIDIASAFLPHIHNSMHDQAAHALMDEPLILFPFTGKQF